MIDADSEDSKSPLSHALKAASSNKSKKKKQRDEDDEEEHKKLKEAKPVSSEVTKNESKTDITKAESKTTKSPRRDGLSEKTVSKGAKDE